MGVGPILRKPIVDIELLLRRFGALISRAPPAAYALRAGAPTPFSIQEHTMDKQIPLDRSVEAELDDHHAVKEIAPDIAYKRLVMVNVVYLGVPEQATGSGS